MSQSAGTGPRGPYGTFITMLGIGNRIFRTIDINRLFAVSVASAASQFGSWRIRPQWRVLHELNKTEYSKLVSAFALLDNYDVDEEYVQVSFSPIMLLSGHSCLRSPDPVLLSNAFQHRIAVLRTSTSRWNEARWSNVTEDFFSQVSTISAHRTYNIDGNTIVANTPQTAYA